MYHGAIEFVLCKEGKTMYQEGKTKQTKSADFSQDGSQTCKGIHYLDAKKGASKG